MNEENINKAEEEQKKTIELQRERRSSAPAKFKIFDSSKTN